MYIYVLDIFLSLHTIHSMKSAPIISGGLLEYYWIKSTITWRFQNDMT